jgi:hypothetical protein
MRELPSRTGGRDACYRAVSCATAAAPMVGLDVMQMQIISTRLPAKSKDAQAPCTCMDGYLWLAAR